MPRMRQEWEINEIAQAILQNSGAKILHDQPDRAFYNRLTDTIHLPPRAAFDSAANYYGTALHETAHWSGHSSRLSRDTLNNSHGFGDIEYAREELRAELASVFLMAERGIPHNPDSHAAYVKSWLKSLADDKNEIFRAARDAHKAADLLIALEHHKSLEQALTHINKPQPSIEQQATGVGAHIPDSAMAHNQPAMEMEM
jgi:putative DNA primase/helicase